ncbi:hypothetical protein LMIV_0202 [Listeria monocytogenes FSL J1-208]|nr:hypothetical protein LMIV_0202 [Listeria monocytogenes FSL J1-208]
MRAIVSVVGCGAVSCCVDVDVSKFVKLEIGVFASIVYAGISV